MPPHSGPLPQGGEGESRCRASLGVEIIDTIQEIFGPLWRNSVLVGLLVGFSCPLVGMYLVLRRLIFLGVALPQVSSCGIACAFALHAWKMIPHFEGGESVLAFA